MSYCRYRRVDCTEQRGNNQRSHWRSGTEAKNSPRKFLLEELLFFENNSLTLSLSSHFDKLFKCLISFRASLICGAGCFSAALAPIHVMLLPPTSPATHPFVSHVRKALSVLYSIELAASAPSVVHQNGSLYPTNNKPTMSVFRPLAFTAGSCLYLRL
jgi:hypothetical protein